MAMDIDPFSMLEVSLQEEPDAEDRRHGSSAGVMHQVENDVEIVQPPGPFQFMGNDVLTPQRVVMNNIQKLAHTSKEEEKFRRRAYSSISLVLRKRLHCTICDAHIGAYLGLKEMDIEHPLLKVLACSKCTLKYHYLEFPLNPDGRDVRCRWCTESAKEESPLRFCSYCPFAFCEMCIYRNLPLDELASNKNNWICFVCNIKDLWPSRAVLWALRVLIDTNLALKEEKKWSTDQSSCCKNKATKQRRPVALPSTVSPQNGHPRPMMPTVNHIRPVLKNPIRQVNPQRGIRPMMHVPTARGVPMSCQNSATQLYDTAWLTEKVHSISTTLLNLNNNLHRIAQGIPEKENKYSIKSKMISMVSLLNISATQLQKASKEMEEESKKILDKNYKVAKVTPVSAPSLHAFEPVKIDSKVMPKTIAPYKIGPKSATLARKRSYSSSSRNKKFKGPSEFDSEYEESEEDFDDPDFQVSSRPGGEGPRTRLKTRACFVKLERLDEKLVGDMKSEAECEPQPSTSKAADPLGTVGPDELRMMEGDVPNGGDVSVKSEESEKATADDKAGTEDAAGIAAPAAESSPPGEAPADSSVSLISNDGSLPDAQEGNEIHPAAEGESPAADNGTKPQGAAESETRAPSGSESPPAAESKPQEADASESQAEAAGPSQAPSGSDSPPAPDVSKAQPAAADDTPPSDAVPDPSPNILNAPHPNHNSSADLDGSQIPALGDDPLNESSATDSSITDSSTSADNSDS